MCVFTHSGSNITTNRVCFKRPPAVETRCSLKLPWRFSVIKVIWRSKDSAEDVWPGRPPGELLMVDRRRTCDRWSGSSSGDQVQAVEQHQQNIQVHHVTWERFSQHYKSKLKIGKQFRILWVLVVFSVDNHCERHHEVQPLFTRLLHFLCKDSQHRRGGTVCQSYNNTNICVCCRRWAESTLTMWYHILNFCLHRKKLDEWISPAPPQAPPFLWPHPSCSLTTPQAPPSSKPVNQCC